MAASMRTLKTIIHDFSTDDYAGRVVHDFSKGLTVTLFLGGLDKGASFIMNLEQYYKLAGLMMQAAAAVKDNE